MKDENRIFIREAEAAFIAKGGKLNKGKAAMSIFPQANQQTAYVSHSNYRIGKSKHMSRLQVLAACEVYDCTPADLFGWDEYLQSKLQGDERE